MPRDSTKILVTGVNRFSLMAIGKGGYYDFSEFEGMPK